MKPWIGVDLDGTLAVYNGWNGPEHIGEPVPAMVERIKGWLGEGLEVRIFTARVAGDRDGLHPRATIAIIQNWLETEAGLPKLPVTNVKDFNMVELYDDRAVQVEFNTGRLMNDSMMQHRRILQEDEEG